MRGWEPILPGVRCLYVRSPANQRSVSGAGVSTPCGAVSTRGITLFVSRLPEFRRYGRIYNPGMGSYPPLGALGLCTTPSQSPIGQWGWVFHRGGRFRPGGSPFSSPDCRSCRFMEGFLNREYGHILPGCGKIVRFPRGATPVARTTPPDWPRAGGGGALGQLDRGSENAGMKVIFLLYYLFHGTTYVRHKGYVRIHISIRILQLIIWYLYIPFVPVHIYGALVYSAWCQVVPACDDFLMFLGGI